MGMHSLSGGGWYRSSGAYQDGLRNNLDEVYLLTGGWTRVQKGRRCGKGIIQKCYVSFMYAMIGTLTHAHTYTHTHTRARASSVHTNCTRKRYTGTHTGYVAHGACTFTCVDSSRVTYYAYFSFIFVLFSFFFRIKSFFCCLPSGEKHGKRRVICRSYSNFFSVKFFSNLRHSLFFFYLIYFVFSLFSFSS